MSIASHRARLSAYLSVDNEIALAYNAILIDVLPTKKKMPKTKVKLLPHESALLAAGLLENKTHANATSIWLHAESTDEESLDKGRILCYRHMGDIEFQHLLQTNQLPSTQPYQTLTRGQEGRNYCESYLRTNKFVNTSSTTVVEFHCSKEMIDGFYSIQRKPEDGTLSHGLGDKGGKTLSTFNAALQSGDTTWRMFW